jgi:quinol monooxygenase YgiN
MLEKTVRLSVSFVVNEGQSDPFLKIAAWMTEASKKEPGTMGYEWFADPGGRHYRLVETYVDAAAVEAHFAGPGVLEGVPKLVTTCQVVAFEFYGDPGPVVVEKATAMGAVFFAYKLGLDR